MSNAVFILCATCYITALQRLFQRHNPAGGIKLTADIHLDRLEYADDVCLVGTTPEAASERLTTFANGTHREA